jgi:hypothetical protein
MQPLADLVFLTPRAALVGLAFAAPLLAVALRERAFARARVTLGLRSPSLARILVRPMGLIALAALVAATAAQPAVRATDSTPIRSDAELLLSFDVSRSMEAAATPGSVVRLERARALGRAVHDALPDVPTGVATLTNRMMPLLFPTGDGQGVTAVIDHALRLMQPKPAALTAARASSLGALTLAADRSYFNPSARKRALVVFTDLDSDFFSLEGTLRLLRQNRIEPFLVRVAAPGERIFEASGRPNTYVSVSTVSVDELRRARWHAFEENERARLIAELRTYLGRGPVGASGLVESQRDLASWFALAAMALATALVFPALRSGLPAAART